MKRIILILLAVALAACGDNPTGDKLTSIRFMNLMTDTNLVLFQVGESNFSSIGFRLATPYQSFGGTFDFDLELINPDNSFTTLIEDRTLTIDGDNGWTFYAVGTVAAPDFIPAFRANGEIAANMSRVQVVNATQESLTTIVYANGQPVSGLLTSATVGARDFATAATVASQSGQVRVERADGTILFDSDEFELVSEADVTIVVTDSVGPGPDPVDVLLVDGIGLVGPAPVTGRASTLRYMHALTNLPDANVTRTDSMQTSTDTALAFATASAREQIEADTYDITVTPAGNMGAPVYNSTAELGGGIEYAIVFTGDLAAPESFEVIEETRPVANFAKISIVHGAAGLADVDIYVSISTEENLSGLQISDVAHSSKSEVDLGAGAYNLTVTNANSVDVVAGPLEVNLVDGTVSTVLLHDVTTGGAPFELSML